MLVVSAGVLVAGVGVAIAWPRYGSVTRGADGRGAGVEQPAQDYGLAAAVAASSAPAAVVETLGPAPEPTPTVRAKSRAAGSNAAEEAAVRFPGAPALKPVTITKLKPKHKYVAITLDDGYGFQPELLKLLRHYDARCTTFLVGSWAANNKSALKKLDKAGFEIANHTWNHETLTRLGASQERSTLLRTQKVISAVTGNQAPYMRPPGGGTNSQVLRVAADLGYKQVMWNRTFGDSSAHPSAKRSYHLVMEHAGGVKPGDIILCHWGKKSTLEAMRRILPELKAQGFEFVTVSELIADSAKGKSKK